MKVISNSKKRILCLMLAMIMLITLFPVNVLATEGGSTTEASVEEVPTVEAPEKEPVTTEAPKEKDPIVKEPNAEEKDPIVKEPNAEEKEGIDEKIPTQEPSTDIKEKVAATATANMDDFDIKYYDKNGQEVENVSMPDYIKFVLTDDAGIPVDTTLFSVEWYREEFNSDRLLASGNTLVFPYTSLQHTQFSVKAIVRELNTGEERTLNIKNNAIVNSKATVLIVDGVAVYPGTSERGISLNAQGDTITFSNVNIDSTVSDFWEGTVITLQTAKKDINIVINGENSITSKVNDGIDITLLDDINANITIKGGGKLNIDLNSDDKELYPMSVFGLKKGSSVQKISLEENTTLNLKSEATSEEDFGGTAFIAGPRAELKVNNGTINAQTDGFRVIDITGDNFYVGKNGKINVISNSKIKTPPPEVLGSNDILGLKFLGKNAIIDGGTVDVLMNKQLASTVNGYFATEATTQVINGGTLKSVIVKNHEEESASAETAAIVSVSFNVDNSTIIAKVTTDMERDAATYGIAFVDDLAIRNGSNVDIEMKGGIFEGIHYGGSKKQPGERQGTVFVKNSNLTINGKNEDQVERTIMPLGLYARYLKTEISEPGYAVKINTSTPANNSIAVFLQKDSTETKTPYNPFYVSERLLLSDFNSITIPQDAAINIYSYDEFESGTPEYINVEVVYGEDKTKPAKDVTITKSDYIFQEIKSEDGTVSVTGNIDKSAKLTLSDVLHPDCPVCEEMKGLKNTQDLIFLKDVSLTGVSDPYIGELVVTFFVGEKYNGKTLNMIHCVNNKAERQSAVVNGGMVKFAVDNLSPFALYAGTTPVEKYHTINAQAIGNGTISEPGDTSVLEGTNQTYYFTPNEGHYVKSVVVDGQTVNTDSKSYTFTDVKANHNIVVTFEKGVNPITGDSTNPWIYLLLIAGSVSVIAGAMAVYKKKTKN